MCINKYLVNFYNILKNKKNATVNYYYAEHRFHAKQQHCPPLILENWIKIVQKSCFYCGHINVKNIYNTTNYKKRVKLWPEKYPKERICEYNINLNGVDRMDSKKGYEVDNCVSCCAMCNRIKNDIGFEEFKAKVKKIYERHCKKL